MSLVYLGVLIGILIGSSWLEIVVRTRVLRRWRRLLLALLPGVILFIGWDLYAIAAGHWTFDPERTSGVILPGDLPLEEALFFLIVPYAGILTLEAVRAVRGWPAGDEAPAGAPAAAPAGAGGVES